MIEYTLSLRTKIRNARLEAHEPDGDDRYVLYFFYEHWMGPEHFLGPWYPARYTLCRHPDPEALLALARQIAEQYHLAVRDTRGARQ